VHRQEDNIRIDLWEIAREGVEKIHLAQDMDQLRVLVNSAMILQVPYKGGTLVVN
jgi:hypothetical protein